MNETVKKYNIVEEILIIGCIYQNSATKGIYPRSSSQDKEVSLHALTQLSFLMSAANFDGNDIRNF